MSLITRTSFLALLLLPAAVSAHGVSAARIQGGAGLEIRYSDGSPLAFGEVRVFAPGAGDEPFQQGYSDRNGRFLFSPDADGAWRLEVDDGMGHGVVKELSVAGGRTEPVSGGPLPAGVKLLSGLGVIALLSGLWLHFAARRRLAAAKV